MIYMEGGYGNPNNYSEEYATGLQKSIGQNIKGAEMTEDELMDLYSNDYDTKLVFAEFCYEKGRADGKIEVINEVKKTVERMYPYTCREINGKHWKNIKKEQK